MKKVVLFIGMSLDGYIADGEGKVDWMDGETSEGDDMQAYEVFIQDVDTVIMGWKTYHQIRTELSPDHWLYSGMTSYVVTHRKQQSTPEIKFIQDSPGDLVRTLKQGQGKDIWICGGAQIVQQLVKEDLIDKYYVSVLPVILGNGIRLFDTITQELKLKLLQTQHYNGIVDLVYERR